ncbi:MAG: hypothetical protein LBD23_17485 [Oscillospiraceae bacterium]|jgi:hypothetical protein|nr:hypothetical protein [Oscillospiraceae bacterium]
MKKTKNILALLLAIVMCISILAACSADEPAPQVPDPDPVPPINPADPEAPPPELPPDNPGRILAEEHGLPLTAFSEMDPITLQAIRSTITIVAAVPILCVYPFLQKHFVKGVHVGSVKG